MADFMRGAGSSPPRVELDVAEIEARHGAPLGLLLVARLRLACKRAPFEPWSAFSALGVYVVVTGSPERLTCTPDDTLPLIETGADLHHAVLLRKDRALPLDRCPVVFVAEGECTVVAPDLAAYLGLVSIAGAEAVTSKSDEAWRADREAWLEAQPDFAAQSEALLSLPGVHLPSSPTAVVRDAERRFGPIAPGVEPWGSGLGRVRDLVETGRPERAREELAHQIAILLGIADVVSRERWQELADLVSSFRPTLTEEVSAQLAARGVSAPRR